MNLKSILIACGLVLLMTLGARANNMLVQNVTTLGNDAVNKTIQVQFDISWDNSWRDDINYDAAWIFMKFKDASGVWQHAQLNQTGFVNGTGTANTVQVTNDKVGSWLYRSGLGSGTFNSTAMQLQWNYGLAGLTNVTGLEVRVFAVEMVYVPEGEFNMATDCYVKSSGYSSQQFSTAPGANFIVINNRLSPNLSFSGPLGGNTIRIKGDVGIDSNADGIIDSPNSVTGYHAFYANKYELTEAQYADYLNTLTNTQVSNIGIAGSSITNSGGQYFSSNPNRACGNSTNYRLLSFADWSGFRPISFYEFNKISYGPLQPVLATAGSGRGFPAWGGGINQASTYPITGAGNEPAPAGNCAAPGNSIFLYRVGLFGATSVPTRQSTGSGYYGSMDLTGNASEPVMAVSAIEFSRLIHGDGILSNNGSTDQVNWSSSIHWVEQWRNFSNDFIQFRGFRFVRSAE